jgi:hypothetical protein
LLGRSRDNHGQLLRNTQVDQLIQAIAAFSSHRAKRLKNKDILLFLIGLVYRFLLVQNFTNSLQAGKMGAYLHASTYVSPTLLLTFLFPRRGP